MTNAKRPRRYTYADYLRWDDGERYELIDGLPYNMSPAPSPIHQAISMNLSGMLFGALGNDKCRAFAAPTDVVLSDHDVVQPDLLIVCDPAKIGKQCIRGAPDLAIEILSPASAARDRIEKKTLYARFGVREYLIFDPETRSAEQYILGADGQYGPARVYADGERLPLYILPGIVLPLDEVFGALPD